MSLKESEDRHEGFLVVTRKLGQGIMIDDSLVIITKIKSKNSVSIAIQTKKSVKVRRVDDPTIKPED
jgi:sRNA-binding carbon storage regulator CsrA